MYKSVTKSLWAWNERHDDRTKLQHSYAAAAIAIVVFAGLIGLLDYDIGQQFAGFALIALGVFFVNLVVWTLLDGLVFRKLDASSKRSARKKSQR
jgi:hypothetical protein